jgi:PAS domain S-box-containing protein
MIASLPDVDPSRPPRILVIDDHLAIHEDFRKVLGASPEEESDLDAMLQNLFGGAAQPAARAHFTLDFAAQGQEGLEKVKSALTEGRSYALAFVDVRMPPGWDGVETIGHLWAVDPSLQVVICTAYSDYSWQEIVGQLGRSDQLVILKKPFDNMEVLQLAHAMTRKWSLTRQAQIRLEDLERMVAERTSALQASEERFSRAFNVSPLPVAILSRAGLRCLTANDAFLRTSALPLDQVCGRTIATAGVDLSETLRARLERGESIVESPCHWRKDGSAPRAARLWAEPFALGGEAHLLAVVQDVSERVALEDRLRQAQKMESVGHLAAGVAHDFNNLLTVILGHASMRLDVPGLPENVTESLRQVSDAAERAANLTRQLLAFSRKQIMQPRVLRMEAVIANLSAMLRRLLPATIEMTLQAEEALPPIFADITAIEQVVLNLVVNARDAMPDGGRLAIDTTAVQIDATHTTRVAEARPGTYLRLSVRDTGAGMDEATKARIFEPFFTTKEVGKGTGMGLATVDGIVKQHDGWIEVESEPQRGTVFRVFLPTTHLREEDPCEETVGTAPRTATQQTILIAEDDPSVRMLAATVLAEQGFTVLEAGDGSQAVAISRSFEGTIDLLLTDMVMPGGLSGKNVAEQVTSQRPGTKVIFSSGYSAELFSRELEMRDGFDYLPKPYFSKGLLNAVSRIFNGPSREPAPPPCEVVHSLPPHSHHPVALSA